MNPIDDAVREGLLESWIYAADTMERLTDTRDSLFRHDPKYEQIWRIHQADMHSFGKGYILSIRDPVYLLETHKELYTWNTCFFFRSVLAHEIQKNMTE